MERLRSGTEWIRVDDLSAAGSARRAATRLAERLNFGAARTAEVGILVSEAASNLFRHATGGAIGLQVVLRGDEPGLQVLSVDRGPGMADLPGLTVDGTSTRGTLGVGLGAITRLADDLDAVSEPGGTVLVAELWSRRGTRAAPWPVPNPDLAGLTRPLLGEHLCGDAVAGREVDGQLVLALFDGLGHGPMAAASSQAAIDAFHEVGPTDPVTILTAIHARLSHTRGTAAAVVTIERDGGALLFAGVGNISAFLDQNGTRQALLSSPGIVGHGQFKARAFAAEIGPDAVLVLHSDGLRENWNLAGHPGLRRRRAAVIAAQLMLDAATRSDDASVLVLRRRP